MTASLTITRGEITTREEFDPSDDTEFAKFARMFDEAKPGALAYAAKPGAPAETVFELPREDADVFIQPQNVGG